MIYYVLPVAFTRRGGKSTVLDILDCLVRLSWPVRRFRAAHHRGLVRRNIDPPRDRAQHVRRFVDLLEWCLAPGGMVVIGHTERNCKARADLQEALRRHFLVRTLRADECISPDWHRQQGNGAGLRAAVVLLCTRTGEAAAEALLAAAACAEHAEPAAAEGTGELPNAPDVGTDSASISTRNAKRERDS